MQDLGTLGGMNSGGSGINSSGQVTGSSYLSGDMTNHAFLYSGGKMQDLGSLGGTNSCGTALNTIGQVVGASTTLSGTVYPHAFLYSGGKMQDLGTLGGNQSESYSINDSGTVVGDSFTAHGVVHAFYTVDNMMVDLNSLLPAGSDWELAHATVMSSVFCKIMCIPSDEQGLSQLVNVR